MDKILELLFRKEALGPISTAIVAALLGGWLTFHVNKFSGSIDRRLSNIEEALIDQWTAHNMAFWAFQQEKVLREALGSNTFTNPDPMPIKFRGMSLESLLLNAPLLNSTESSKKNETIWKPLNLPMMAQRQRRLSTKP